MSKGITAKFYELAHDIQVNGLPVMMDFSELLENFSVSPPSNKTVDDIERIINWLEGRRLKAEPNLRSVPDSAKIKISPRNNTIDIYEAQEQLQLNALPCAHIGRENLPLIKIDNECNLNVIVTEIIQHKEQAVLIVEDQSGKPKGIIDAYSFATFIKSNSANTKVEDIMHPIFLISKSTDSLTLTIDRMINENKPYLIIINDNNHITGFTSLQGLFKEFYPISKPFFLISKIEALINKVLKKIDYPDSDYINEVPPEQLARRLKGGMPGPTILTLGEKIQLLNSSDNIHMNTKYSVSVRSIISSGYNILNQATNARNNILHFRTIQATKEDENKLNLAIEWLESLLTILPKNQNNE